METPSALISLTIKAQFITYLIPTIFSMTFLMVVNFSIPSRPLGHTIRDNALTQLSNETNGGSNGNININVNPQGHLG